MAIILALITARVVWSSRVEWRDAQARMASADHALAIDHFGRAARLYAPGNPYSTRARQALVEIALQAETHRDNATALSAWRELRSSILAVRSFYTPARGLLDEANKHIATIAAAEESPALQPGASLAQRERWHADRLAMDDAPSVAWTVVALLGFFLWIGAAIGFLWRALDENDRMRRRAALFWGLGIILGVVFFFLGLARA